MRIYTSYFANSKKLTQAGIMVIGVALYPPRWFNGVSVKSVAPTPSILHARGQTQEKYTERYRNEVLSRVNPHQFMENLRNLSQGHDVALCCYEKPGTFCHRHILAEWLSDTTGETVTEWGASDNPKQPEQLVLFG